MPSPTNAPAPPPALVASAEGELRNKLKPLLARALLNEKEAGGGCFDDLADAVLDCLAYEKIALVPAAILSRLTAADTYPSGEPTTDLDHARYDRDAWMESALRAQGYVGELQGRLAAALARAERAEKALDFFRSAAVTSATMEGLIYRGVSTSMFRHAWEADRAALAHPAPAEEA